MSRGRCATFGATQTTLQMEESEMEYDQLVNYYRERLLERYRASLDRPELLQIKEKLEGADAETLREVLLLLKDQSAK